jgi:hypothetical protein
MGRRGSILLGDDADHALEHTMIVMECDQQSAVLSLKIFAFEVKKLVRRPNMWPGIELIANSLLSSRGMALDADSVNELLETSGVPQVKPSYWSK